MSRAENGSAAVHPLSGVELRALRWIKRDQEPPSPFVFTSERGAPFTTAGWRKMMARLGVAAKLGFKAHPHMLRHACGFQLANQGTDTRTLQAYLGHRNIQHTVRYSELSKKSLARLITGVQGLNPQRKQEFMSEQLGLLFLVLFVLAAAACVYLSFTLSRRVQMGIDRWRNRGAAGARNSTKAIGQC